MVIGSLTQNGLFQEAVRKYKEGTAPPERVKVYEKIRSGIWVYNGLFELVDCWIEQSGGKVFKFKLEFSATDDRDRPTIAPPTLEDDRLIPSWVKLQVWKRDQGRCQKCGTTSGLYFDHIIPYSKGGCRQTGQDQADGFNQESQTHGLRSSGIETILWRRNFASNFRVRRRFVASEAAFSGTLPRCTLVAFNGEMRYLSISAVQSWMWHLKYGSNSRH